MYITYYNKYKTDVEMATRNFHRLTNNFDCRTYMNQSHGSYGNGYFHKRAQEAFIDYLEFCRDCFGMPMKIFRNKYLMTNIAEFYERSNWLEKEKCYAVRFRYKSAVTDMTYFRTMCNGKRGFIIFPSYALVICDMDREYNTPHKGKGYIALGPAFILSDPGIPKIIYPALT
ncbi:MAG TPA: hypothetical protein DIW17_13115 [Clostridiales bacterium]|nr:hypothetical protein [Lachnospiraceae bacterium]HCS74801.1 hypothetical protein [Clostridiales bacterium]